MKLSAMNRKMTKALRDDAADAVREFWKKHPDAKKKKMRNAMAEMLDAATERGKVMTLYQAYRRVKR